MGEKSLGFEIMHNLRESLSRRAVKHERFDYESALVDVAPK